MPRYLIERSFPQGLSIPLNDDGRKALDGVVQVNADHGVTWVHSYVNTDRTQTFCIYDGRRPSRSARWPSATACRSPASPRSACSTRTSIVPETPPPKENRHDQDPDRFLRPAARRRRGFRPAALRDRTRDSRRLADDAEQLRDAAKKSNSVLRDLGPDIQWVQSYVAGDKIYCVYNAPSEALIREHAADPPHRRASRPTGSRRWRR
jgi:hypothetical protein